MNINNIAVVLMVIILFIIPGCSGDIIPPPPPEPDIFAEVSGYDNLHFETVVNPTWNDAVKQYNYSGFMNKNGKKYSLIIGIFYHDSDLYAGTYNFSPNTVPNQVYAIGSLIINNGKSDKVFLSDSGTINITKKIGMSIEATYEFYATLKDSTAQIRVYNGILKKN
ncbi:MAG: hypothetical protein EPN82_12515 [Bacteroidetes bacterium]|nr:MAG: hypothetical protein EPN82_12515 [Bacteroidota bacterium]